MSMDPLDFRPPGPGCESRQLRLRELLETPEGTRWVEWACRRPAGCWPDWFEEALDAAEDEIVRRAREGYDRFWKRAAV